MEKLLDLSVERTKKATSHSSSVEEFSAFDEVMEKVTAGMFKVILFGGIPYFLWILIQFSLKF
jgi:hypothetical protein